MEVVLVTEDMDLAMEDTAMAMEDMVLAMELMEQELLEERELLEEQVEVCGQGCQGELQGGGFKRCYSTLRIFLGSIKEIRSCKA